MKEESIINIRKLAALDMAIHGQLPITIEFFLGVFLIALIGLLVFYSGQTNLGIYMMFMALNYIPLLIYALLIGGKAHKEVRTEMHNLKHYGRKYNLQQFLIFIPLSIIVLSILQEFKS